MHWTIDQLEAFTTAASAGSFSAAARQLGKAQSRVSTAIANLEADLNVELFDRSARLPVLTPVGKEILNEAHAVLAQCQRLNARATSATNQQEIELVIAIDEAVPILAFQSILSELALCFPLLKLTLINGSRDDISALVEKKTADIGVLFHSGKLPACIEFHPIGSFQQTLITSLHHPLAKVTAPTISELAPFRQLVICDKRGDGREKPITANHWHIDSYFMITELVIQGLGWALIPDHVAQSHWYHDDIKHLSTENIHRNMLVEVGIVKRTDHGVGMAFNWLIGKISTTFK
ncbi:LysR family transcriptional regulator [Thaumasiovibrio sp. DFM-14]|uniref:LysR family transcriptional regulator n=1 Tax=Thaumasiovibrio sp. DFM-14 TaxID=3384792 RepID=UPI0039A29F3A